MILLLVSLLLWNIPSFAFSASSEPKIKCLIINLDYVNCTWSEPGLKNNYSFKSWFTGDKILDCPEYHRINGVNVGCVLPYENTQRFRELNTLLYSDNSSLVTKQEYDLKTQVKLHPPFNLSVVDRKDAELWLYWNVTNNENNCIECEVRHRTDKNDWKKTSPGPRSSFSLPFPSKKRYEFQVRSRISSSCGESMFWSEWSQSVYWGSLKTNNGTVSEPSIPAMYLVLYAVGATAILVILSCLLVQHERLRIILIPVVPNAGKNVSKYLASLFDNDGNIEKWLSMPKDLENGFKPNFTERACPVREYSTKSPFSSDSESMLSNPTDLSSDYQCMHSYSSASTIAGPAEALPTQDPFPEDNPV